MIKVLHVFECFAQGGIENFVMNVYRKINREEIQFDFAFINRSKGVFDDEVISMGANIYYFENESKTFANYSKSLTSIIKDHGPYDVIHSHMYFFSGYILKIAKKCGVPIRIAHCHETLKGRKPTLKRRIYESIMKKMIKKNSTVRLSCSNAAGMYMFDKPDSFKILYNGISMKRFMYNLELRNECRKNLNISDDEILVLNVGRFAPQKNHDFTIHMFKKLYEKSRKYKLVLIGDGILLDEIKLLVNKYQLNNAVIFLSNIYDTESYYNAADIFILPSLYEGMGIVTIEAQATGLVTLISDKVTTEVGITELASFLPIDNYDAWINEIDKKSFAKYDRSEYYKRVENTSFDINETVNILTNVYKGI